MPGQPRNGRASQRGNAVLAVTVLGTIGTMVLAGVMNHATVLEERAIDAQLADTRAYWWTMGQFNYALSRVRHSAACKESNPLRCLSSQNGRDGDKADAVKEYLKEIEDDYWETTFPGEPSSYRIRLKPDSRKGELPGAHSNFSGHLKITVETEIDSPTLPVMQDLQRRVRDWKMEYCVGLNQGETCGPLDSNNGGYYRHYFSIKRIVPMLD